MARATLIQNVALPLVYAKVAKTTRLERAQLLLEKMGLGHKLAAKPNEISGGEQQRVAIARAMDNDFSVQNLTALANTAIQTTRILSLMLGAIASISLIVGRIGIMNIMLVSVTERTREIGIRAALGARRKDILLQFLLEVVIISFVGCALGVILGISCAFLVNRLFELNIVISLRSIFAAFAIAGSVGIFFGYYPAHKAAYAQPIEALRYQ